MGGLEAVITGVMDEFRGVFRRWRYSREVFTGAVVLSAFLLAVPNVTNVSQATPRQSLSPHTYIYVSIIFKQRGGRVTQT